MTPTLEELEQQLAELNEQQRVTAALVEALRAYEQKVVTKNAAPTQPVIRQRSPSRSSSAMEATERVAILLMDIIGGPVQTSQVVDEMRDQGIELPETNTNNTISARLSNNPKFRAKRGKGYWFADRPWPGEPVEPFDDVIERAGSTNAPDERGRQEGLTADF
jgi:hypothetical protein